MPIVEFPITINDKEQILKIETDPAWGQIQMLMQNSYTMGENGVKEINMMGFLDQLLEIVIVGSSGDFNIKNRTMVKSLPTSVMTKLIGGVTKLIPLQDYLDNMGEIQNSLSRP